MTARLTTGLAILWIAGCSGTAWRHSGDVLDTRMVLVEREQRTAHGQPIEVAPGHPAEVTPEAIAGVVAGLAYRSQGLFQSNESAPVVEPGLVDALSIGLAEGLAGCGPAERVRFLVRNAQLSLGFLPTERITRGVAFVDPPGILNLVFDRVGAIPDLDDPGEETRWRDPTWNQQANVALTLPAGVRLHRDDQDRERPLWVVAHLGELPTPPTPLPGAPPSSETLTEARTDSGAPAPTTDASAPTPDPVSSPPDPAQLTDRERLSRLRYLEELHVSRSITPEEYERQKRALLAPEDRR